MSTFTWIFLTVILLYVLKTLYDVNMRQRYEDEMFLGETLEERQKEVFSTPLEMPKGVVPEASLQQAELYEMEEEETEEEHEEAPLPVIRELIPETEEIDLDSFVYFQGARLLVVEDNPLNQKIIGNVLKQSGIVIDIAENGQRALDYLFKEHKEYDLVLMDISMPEMDGITATKIIRRASRFNRLPIVAFTAFSLGPEIEAMFKAGANAYLIKPLNIKQLYTVFMLFMGNVNRGLPLHKMFEIQGLDVEKGLENANGNEWIYADRLKDFIRRYSATVEHITAWIEEKRYERVRLECKEMLPVLSQIGAHDMYEMVHEIEKQFMYGNEHLLDKYKVLFRAKMQALIDTINVYLKSLKEKDQA